jgi:hypothetical protein
MVFVILKKIELKIVGVRGTLILSRGESRPPSDERGPPALRMILQVVCKVVTLGRLGISVVSTNTKIPSPGDTPRLLNVSGFPIQTCETNSQHRTVLDTMVPNLFCIMCPGV